MQSCSESQFQNLWTDSGVHCSSSSHYNIQHCVTSTPLSVAGRSQYHVNRKLSPVLDRRWSAQMLTLLLSLKRVPLLNLFLFRSDRFPFLSLYLPLTSLFKFLFDIRRTSICLLLWRSISSYSNSERRCFTSTICSYVVADIPTQESHYLARVRTSLKCSVLHTALYCSCFTTWYQSGPSCFSIDIFTIATWIIAFITFFTKNDF